MEFRIAFDPTLDLEAAEFVSAWNGSELVAEGTAVVDEAPPASFLPLEVSVALITAAVSIPGTVIATYISAYLKDKYIDGKKRTVTVTTVSDPDGTPLYIVTQEEGVS